MANDFISTLLDFPPEKHLTPKDYDKKAHDFVKSLNKHPEATWAKQSKQQNILELLNPATNTIPYLYVLNSQTANAGKDRNRNEEVLNNVVMFLTAFDPIQVRYVGEQWLDLVTWVCEVYPKLGVLDCTPLVTAMLRLDPTTATFTSTHLRVVRLCLSNGVPGQALPILDNNISAYPQTAPKGLPDEPLCLPHEQSNAFITASSGFTMHPIKSEWVLEYYLLGAHIYLGQRNFARARLFLEYLLLHPSANSSGSSCSALQTEAYKKWVLLGLLAQGETYPLPRTHSQSLFKTLKAVSKAYDSLADTFTTRQWRKFAAEVEVGQQIWQEDGNARLVKEVSDALLRYRVLDLQNTYAVLPVSGVASRLNLPHSTAQSLISSMMQQGHIDLAISASSPKDDPVLHFRPSTATSSPQRGDSLEAQTLRLQTLLTSIRDADRRLQLTKEHIEVQKRLKRSAAANAAAGGPDGDLAEQMDLTYDAPIAGLDEEDLGGEEDIMER